MLAVGSDPHARANSCARCLHRFVACDQCWHAAFFHSRRSICRNDAVSVQGQPDPLRCRECVLATKREAMGSIHDCRQRYTPAALARGGRVVNRTMARCDFLWANAGVFELIATVT